MDNKELKGLSEAYNEVYLDEALPAPGKSKGAVTMYNTPRAPNPAKEKASRLAKQGPNPNYAERSKIYAGDPLRTKISNLASQIQSERMGNIPRKEGTGRGGPSDISRPVATASRPGAPTPSPRPAPQPVQSTRTPRPSTGLSTPASTSRPVVASSPRPAATTPSVSPRPAAAPSPRPTAATAPRPAAPSSLSTGGRRSNSELEGKTFATKSTSGGTKYEVRTPTSAELAAARNAGGGEKGVQAAVARSSNLMNNPTATPIAAAVKPATPTPQKRNQAPSRAPITQMNSYDFGKPDHITQDVASLYQSIYEGKKKVDQDQDGDNDFADVRIARMVASGMSLKDAIAAVRNKSYNEETELDEGRSENIRDKMVARYGKPASGDTLRLHVARKKYDKAATKHQSGYGPNPRTEIKGKLNPGQLMYKAGQSANVNKEDFEFWVNDLLDEGYDLSEYTVDEMYEIFEETALERRKAEEERKNNRRARVAEMQAQGRVMTPAKRAAAQRAAKAAEKREAALEKAAQAAINDIHGATGRVSEKPMGSEGPAAKKAAPVATRRLRTGLKRDTLGSAADAVLKDIRKEDFEFWVNELLDEGYDLSDYTWDELGELYEGAAGDVAARAKKLARQRGCKKTEIGKMYLSLAQKAGDRETPPPSGRDWNYRTGMTAKDRASKRGMSDWNIEHDKPGGITKNPKKLRKQRALGEFGENYDAYDLVIGHLLDEGFADDCDSANMMIERMSDEWLNEILESKYWIQKAIKKPGALHTELGVPMGKKIPAKKLTAAAKSGGKMGRRARLAKTLRKFH